MCVCDMYMSDEAHEVVLFIHGFISSSAFWTETLFPNFSSASKSTYRLFAIDRSQISQNMGFQKRMINQSDESHKSDMSIM